MSGRIRGSVRAVADRHQRVQVLRDIDGLEVSVDVGVGYMRLEVVQGFDWLTGRTQ